jgi:hypothetical protein
LAKKKQNLDESEFAKKKSKQDASDAKKKQNVDANESAKKKPK